MKTRKLTVNIGFLFLAHTFFVISCGQQTLTKPIDLQSASSLGDGPTTSDRDRLLRFGDGLVSSLLSNTSGAKGQLTAVCEAPLFDHVCKSTCTQAGGIYTQAIIDCHHGTLANTPTELITFKCQGDGFSQGFQGSIALTMNRVAADTLKIQIDFSGDMHLLTTEGTYSSIGIYNRWYTGSVIFSRVEAGGSYSYNYDCADGSTLSIAGENQTCSNSALLPFIGYRCDPQPL